MGNLVFQATLGGQVNLVGPNTASTYNINVPTVNGNLVTTGDTGTVTNTMLAGSIANAKLSNSSVTIGSTSVSLGATASSISGLTDVSTATLTASGNVTLSGGTANGVAYLNGSKVLTTGSALTFDGTTFSNTTANAALNAKFKGATGMLRVRPYVDATFGSWIDSSNAAESAYLPLSFLGSTVNNYFDTAATWNILGGSESMRLTSTGLGIGTSSPAEKLDVSGNITSTLASSVGKIVLRNSSTTSAELHVRPSSGKNGWLSFTEDSVADRWVVGVKTGNGSLFFNTGSVGSNTDRMTLDSSGNLGLGVTPSAWGSFVPKAIQLPKGVALASQSNANAGHLVTNAFYDGAWKYVETAAASSFVVNNTGSSGFAWFTAPSGTAGNAISFTQAMTLDASGNLLVGTTSSGGTPSQGFNLLANSGSSFSIGHASGTLSGAYYQIFAYNGGLIGSITQNGTTGVLYNLTSDYRLKNNPVALTGSGAFIDALQPKTWDWWDGSGKGVGFIAHEFMEVAKYSGNGEKDAVDENGNPVYQSIQPSSSEVMANLVAEIKSLRQRLAAAGIA